MGKPERGIPTDNWTVRGVWGESPPTSEAMCSPPEGLRKAQRTRDRH
jgi:hypothetical protein